MKRIIFTILVTFALGGAANATPGDAAQRAGQLDAAEKLYKRGAEQGDPVAAYKLARMRHTDADQKSIYWYKKSIELGKENDYHSVMSAYYLGDIYTRDKDYKNAKYWYEKSASVGHHYSMYSLGGVYAESNSGAKEDVIGLMWINIVTKMASTFENPNKGHLWVLNDKSGYKKMLKDRMNQKDIKKSDQLADDWLSDFRNKK